MDFIAINIGSLDVAVGDYVEVIGPNADVFKNYPHAPHAIITNFKHRRINLEVTHQHSKDKIKWRCRRGITRA